MTDFVKYKKMLDFSNTRYEVWQDGTAMVVDVENDDACFSFYFDILTGLPVWTHVYSKVYSE